MSLSTYITIYTRQDAVPDLFARIYQRLFADQTADITFMLMGRDVSTPLVAAETVAHDLASFVRQTIFPDRSVDTRRGWYPYPPRNSYLDLICQGPLFGRRAAQDEGYIQLRFSDRAFLNLADYSGSIHYPPSIACQGIPDRLVTPQEAMICRILGVEHASTPDPAIAHLAVVNEAYIGGLEAAYLVYHQDRRAFLRDLAISYARYHWGLGRQILLEHDVDVWDLNESEIASYRVCEPWKDRATPSFTTDQVAHWHFLATLSRETIQRIATYAGDVETLLDVVLARYPAVRHYPIAERGLMISLDPGPELSNLWPWYVDLATLATQT